MSNLLNLLQRYSDSGNSTLGLMLTGYSGNGALKFSGYTLEDEAREIKVLGETRIPAGYYELKPRQVISGKTLEYREKYDWFTWHIEIMDVRNFSFAYVHIGNKDKDTDGCVLIADNANNNQIAEGLISSSTECFKRWYLRHMKHFDEGGKAFLRIRDENFLSPGA